MARIFLTVVFETLVFLLRTLGESNVFNRGRMVWVYALEEISKV